MIVENPPTTTATGATLTETSTVSASGASVDFTGIPSTARRIVGVFTALSPSSGGDLSVRIGDSGGFESTGYDSYHCRFNNTTLSPVIVTTEFDLLDNFALGDNYSGRFELNLVDASTFTWVLNSIAFRDGGGANDAGVTIGTKSLSATLTQVQVLTSAGTFDAGKIKLSYFE